MARRMALDQLAAMVARGFEDVHRQMTGVRGELTGVQEQMMGVRDELTGVQEQMIGFRDEQASVREQSTSFLDETTGLRGQFRGLQSDLTDLRSEMRDGFASLRAAQTEHSHRLDRIERKLDTLVGHGDDHEVRIQSLEKRRGPGS